MRTPYADKEAQAEGQPARIDCLGRRMWVDEFPCGCCGDLVKTNAWSYYGVGVRCPDCRRARCVKTGPNRKARCGKTQ